MKWNNYWPLSTLWYCTVLKVSYHKFSK